MQRIQEVFKHARRCCMRAKGIVILKTTKGLTAIGLKNTRKAAADNKFEITQAVFPDKISDTRRTMPGAQAKNTSCPGHRPPYPGQLHMARRASER